MDILLSIIGTIVILLLKILLVLLLLLCFLVFCPVFYKGRAEFGKALLAEGRVCWLFGLVWFSVSCREGEVTSRFRLFGIDIQKVAAWREKRKRRKMLKKAARKKKPQTASDKTQKVETEEEPGAPSDEGKPSAGADWQEPGDLKEEEGNTEKSVQRNSSKRKQAERRRKKRSRLCGRLKKRTGWIKDAKEFWHSENTVRMVCILKDNVLHLWRKLKPKVLRGNIIFGTGDPCTTGQILGVAAVFYAFYGKGIQIIPDFEEARLEGNLFIRGRISLITMIIILFRIFFCREWSRFRQEAKQLKEAL